MPTWRALLFLLVGFWLPQAALAASEPAFPPLTGRVVDAANILSAQTEQTLTQELARFEAATQRQVVVVTVADLQGYAIDDYGTRLGRFWGIGPRGKNSGALLIVAPKERSVRIEVGYGLEGELTDAQASQIIQQTILPRFRQNDFNGGVSAGTAAVLTALGWSGGRASSGPRPSQAAQQINDFGAKDYLFLLFFCCLFAVMMIIGYRRATSVGPWGRRYNDMRHINISGSGGFGGGFGGGGGGGFRGGGGSFGGGGASGRW